ncbi:hypothetical protein FOZ63_021887, partial [Perkinsus olseni]
MPQQKSKMWPHLRGFYDKEGSKSADDKDKENIAFLSQSLKPSTLNQYQTPVRYFEAGFGPICAGNRVTLTNLIAFIRALTDSREIQAATVRKYTSAIKSTAQIRLGQVFSLEENQVIDRALRSADNVLSSLERPTKRAVVLPEACLKALSHMQLQFASLGDQIRAAALLGSTAMLRFQQVAGLRATDVTWGETPQGTLVRLDFFNTKTSVHEEREILCSSGCLCTKLHCVAHHVVKMSRRATDPSHRVFPDLSTDTYSEELKNFLMKEFPQHAFEWRLKDVTKHSLRRSGASILSDRGVSSSQIKAGGNWRSSAFESYVDES